MQLRHTSVIRHQVRPVELCIGDTKTGGHYLAVDVTPPRRHAHYGAARHVATTIKRRKYLVSLHTSPPICDPALDAVCVANQAVLPLNDMHTAETPAEHYTTCAMAYIEPVSSGVATFRSVGGCGLTIITENGPAKIDFPRDPGVLTGAAHLPGASQSIRLPVKAGDTIILGTPTARPLMGSAEFATFANRSPSSLRRWLKKQALPPTFGVSIIQVGT